MTASYPAARPGVEPQTTDIPRWTREAARIINNMLKGWLNCSLTVTLTDNASTTTVTDSRISIQTFPGFTPQTAHAAAEIGNGTLYAVCTASTLTIHHANNAQTDRTFSVCLIG